MIEVAPAHCVVEVSKSAGDLVTFKEVIWHSLITSYASTLFFLLHLLSCFILMTSFVKVYPIYWQKNLLHHPNPMILSKNASQKIMTKMLAGNAYKDICAWLDQLIWSDCVLYKENILENFYFVKLEALIYCEVKWLIKYNNFVHCHCLINGN